MVTAYFMILCPEGGTAGPNAVVDLEERTNMLLTAIATKLWRNEQLGFKLAGLKYEETKEPEERIPPLPQLRREGPRRMPWMVYYEEPEPLPQGHPQGHHAHPDG